LLSGPFYKAVCKVSGEEFEQPKACLDLVVITESAFGGAEVAIGLKPRQKCPRRSGSTGSTAEFVPCRSTSPVVRLDGRIK
jgi:hypothetical protein